MEHIPFVLRIPLWYPRHLIIRSIIIYLYFYNYILIVATERQTICK